MEEKLIKCIRDNFLKRVDEDERDSTYGEYDGVKYYYKWMPTWDLMKETNMKASVIRYQLNKLEKQRLVHSKRRHNYILWAVEIEGFEQHQFSDYYCRKNS